MKRMILVLYLCSQTHVIEAISKNRNPGGTRVRPRNDNGNVEGGTVTVYNFRPSPSFHEQGGDKHDSDQDGDKNWRDFDVSRENAETRNVHDYTNDDHEFIQMEPYKESLATTGTSTWYKNLSPRIPKKHRSGHRRQRRPGRKSSFENQFHYRDQKYDPEEDRNRYREPEPELEQDPANLGGNENRKYFSEPEGPDDEMMEGGGGDGNGGEITNSPENFGDYGKSIEMKKSINENVGGTWRPKWPPKTFSTIPPKREREELEPQSSSNPKDAVEILPTIKSNWASATVNVPIQNGTQLGGAWPIAGPTESQNVGNYNPPTPLTPWNPWAHQFPFPILVG